MKQMKRMVLLLLTLVFAVSLPLSAFAAGTIEVTEDVSVSDDYDWTRFKGQNVTLNVYNWGEYISDGSDDAMDVNKEIEALTEQAFAGYLDTAGMPDPDLVIRTSGEFRISNYLLWQSAYAEYYITPVLWPDFTKDELLKAIDSFNSRERRFGGRKK